MSDTVICRHILEGKYDEIELPSPINPEFTIILNRILNLLFHDEEQDTYPLIDDLVNKYHDTAHLELLARNMFDYDTNLFRYVIKLRPELISSGSYTVLHCAAQYHPSRLPMLFELGADINKRIPGSGSTPLDKAFIMRQEESIILLLKQGANVMICNGSWLKDGFGSNCRCCILLKRAYYLSLLCRSTVLHKDLFKITIEMLVL